MGHTVMMLGWIDVLGYAASGMTLATFAQRTMRIMALGSSLCFIGYGAMGPFMRVLELHLILLPINLARLQTLVRQSCAMVAPAPGEAADQGTVGCSSGLL